MLSHFFPLYILVLHSLSWRNHFHLCCHIFFLCIFWSLACWRDHFHLCCHIFFPLYILVFHSVEEIMFTYVVTFFSFIYFGPSLSWKNRVHLCCHIFFLYIFWSLTQLKKLCSLMLSHFFLLYILVPHSIEKIVFTYVVTFFSFIYFGPSLSWKNRVHLCYNDIVRIITYTIWKVLSN
jgi:hypothetical protein